MVLPLWLSILESIPFDMETNLMQHWWDKQNHLIEVGEGEEQIPPPLLQRMVKLCNQHLSSPGPTRETTDWYVLMTL
jgi:hypothetical protein